MDFSDYILLVFLGFAAGFINIFAGGGSMLVVPFLIFLGLPANIANATNRIAILFQNTVSVFTFQQKKILDLRTDYKLLFPVLLGSIAGAFTAVDIQKEVLEKIIGGLLIVMFFMVGLNPNAWIRAKAEKAGLRRIHSNRSRLFPFSRTGSRMWIRFTESQCRKNIFSTLLYPYRFSYFYILRPDRLESRFDTCLW